MKTNFARHYKFSLSKKTLFLILSILAITLLAATAFAVSQNASANDEAKAENDANFYISLESEGPGHTSKDSLNCFNGGWVYVTGHDINSEEKGGSVRRSDNAFSFKDDNAVFDGWYWKNGKRITDREGSHEGTIVAKFSEGWVLKFNESEHGDLVVKDDLGHKSSDNTIVVCKGATCSWDGTTLKFNRPDDDKELMGTVEWTADPGYFLAEWNPSLPKTITENTTFTPVFKEGCNINFKWDSKKGNVVHVSGTKTFPFYVEKNLVVSPIYEEPVPSISFYKDSRYGEEIEYIALDSIEQGNVFAGWFIDGVRLEENVDTPITKDTEIEAKFVDPTCALNFDVYDGFKDIGHVSESAITIPSGTKYHFDGASIIFEGTDKKVTAIADKERYEFDYWSIDKEILKDKGQIFFPATIKAHFIAKDNWRITGTVVKNTPNGEVPVEMADVFYYYVDQEQSKTHLAASCKSVANGYFEMFISDDVTKGYLDSAHSTEGTSSQQISKPSKGNIDNCKIVLKQDPDFVYFYGRVNEGTTFGKAIEDVDIAFNFDSQPGQFAYAKTNKQGDYLLKVDKKNEAGMIVASAFGYVMGYRYIVKGQLEMFCSINQDFILNKGINNTFALPDQELCDGYKVDLYMNDKLRLQDTNINQIMNITVPENSEAKYCVNNNQVVITYNSHPTPDYSFQIKYVVETNFKFWCLFTEWELNGNPVKQLPWKDLTSTNAFAPHGEEGVCIYGLITGETDFWNGFAPVSDALVCFTDKDYNVLSYTYSDEGTTTNYTLPAIPHNSEGYLIVLKNGYNEYVWEIEATQTQETTLKIDPLLTKIAPGSDSYIFGQVTEDEAGTPMPVANASVYFINDDSSIVDSTLTSTSGYYLLKVPYEASGTVVCLADSYKPYLNKYIVEDLICENNIVLEKNSENVNATFKYVDNLESLEFEVLSSDGLISYGKFDINETITLQFEVNTRYALMKTYIDFLYGDYIIRIHANASDGWAVKKWDIDPEPTLAWTLSVNSVFTPELGSACQIDATYDSAYGVVQSTKQTLPYNEVIGSQYIVNENLIRLNGTDLLAKEKPNGLFIGWYLNGQKLENQSYQLTSSTTFEARFVKTYYSVSFAVAEGQDDFGYVDHDLIDNVKYGSLYNITNNKIVVNGTSVIAHSNDPEAYAFDYWTLNGQKVEDGQDYVCENMQFVAHFKDLRPWHIKGKVTWSAEENFVVSDSYVFAQNTSGEGEIVDGVYSKEDGSYELSIPRTISSVNLGAAHVDYGYHFETVENPQLTDVVKDIALDKSLPYALIYGKVTDSVTKSTIEGLHVNFIYDNLETEPVSVLTDEDGSYVLKVDTTQNCGGVLFIEGWNYSIEGKHFSKDEIKSSLLINYDVSVSAALNQNFYVPTDSSCKLLHGTWYINDFLIKESDTKEGVTGVGLPQEGAKLKVDGSKIELTFKFIDEFNMKICKEAIGNDSYIFSHWLLNGEPITDGTEIDISQDNYLYPVFNAVCEISGTVTELYEVEGVLPPIQGAEVIFFDEDNRVIASDTTNANGDWSFGDSVIKGTSGNIAFLKKGYKPHLSPVSSSETRQKSMKILTTLVKSEEADDYYVYGQVTAKTEANADPIPIPNAYIMFYNTEDGTYKECYADANGTYLLAAEQGEKGYLLCIADGYRPSFSEFTFSEYIQVQSFELEKYDTDVNANFPLSLNQKCFKIEVLDKDTYETYAEIDYYGSLNLNFQKNTKYYSLYDYVTILGNEYTYRFTAVPDVNYDFYKWTISSGSTTGILSADTSFTPSFVYQTSPVILNKGEAVKGFNYKYYINDTLIWDKDEDYVQDESYVNTVITVNENGIIESHFNVELENNEGEVDLWSRITPKAEDGYVFDNLYVNDALLEPGNKLVVENGKYYFGEINYKQIPQPVPPSPTPDEPEYVNGGQTGDGLLPLIMILVTIIAVAGVLCFRKE